MTTPEAIVRSHRNIRRYVLPGERVVFTARSHWGKLAEPVLTTFGGFLEWAESRYARVLFLGAGGTDLLSREWGATVLATARFRLPEYDAPLNAFPRYASAKQFDYTVYELMPGAGEELAAEFVLDIGVRDDLNVLRFHAKEETEERFGEYQLIVDALADRLLDVREAYASTLDDETADEYRSAFNRTATKRFRRFAALLED